MTLAFEVRAEDAGCRLGVFLRRQGVSVTLLRRLKYEEAGLLVDGSRSRSNRPLQAGQRVEITLPEDGPPALEPQPLPLDIVYESPHAMVLNKPAGLVMHPTLSHKDGTLANAFAALMQARGVSAAFRPVGRLDADTSGLVLCAMHSYAAPLLAKSLQKVYLALAGGQMPTGPGSVDVSLGSAPGSAILQQVDAQGKESHTDYEVLASCPTLSLLRLTPRTGRTHQIRVHMAHIGHPLLGDGLYGGDTSRMQRHALHCAQLRFTPPQAPAQEIAAPLPADMAGLAAVFGLSGG